MHSDSEWLVPFAGIAAVQLTLWWIAWLVGMAGQPLITLYNIVALAGLALAMLPFSLRYLWFIRTGGERRPLARIAKDISPLRISAVVIAILLASITAGAFSALKAALPLAVPFYLDVPLATFERVIFRVDPWRIMHAHFAWATPLIDRFYLSWLPVMLVSFNLVLLSRPSGAKTRSLLAYVVMWPLVGTLGSYLLSSAGPIFEEPSLRSLLSREGATGTLLAYNHLWTAYTNRFETLGGGISAMPSMHIAMALWLAMTVRGYFPRWQWAAWAYLALIWFGSVHLGWHYVSDGVAGIAGALLVWRYAPLLAFMCHRRRPVLAPR